MKSDKLIAYFSAEGNTAKVAKILADGLDADIFEIKPTTRYTTADLDWMNKNSRSSVEMADEKNRPQISDKLENFDYYKTIYLGFPVWWYVEPRIIDTFLESYDFTGKIVVPFATSGGSGIENCEKHLKAVCPVAIWKKGKRLTNSTIEQWLTELKKGI